MKQLMKQLGLQIVVIDNGFVHVGDCEIQGDFLNISNCRNIRKWGTTEGLGQLRNGPLKSTLADKCGSVLVPMQRVVFLLAATGW